MTAAADPNPLEHGGTPRVGGDRPRSRHADSPDPVRVRSALEEFTIRIETPDGTECDEEKAAAFDEAMVPSGAITRIETSHSSRSGTIASTFGVRAPSIDEAQDLALQVFTAALATAQVRSEDGWLVIDAGGP